MANSVMQDRQGPDWPLGFIAVPTPGTPVSIMSLVDASKVNAPESATSATSDEYTAYCQQIIFQGSKPGVSHGTQPNTGNVYIVRKGAGGAGNRDDYGAIVKTLQPGDDFYLSSAPVDRNQFSPYRYFVDADTAGDGVQVTLIIG